MRCHMSKSSFGHTPRRTVCRWLAKVQTNEVYREHLAAAREAFYAAEGLKRFGRDICVDDEFGKLLDMVRKGNRLKVNSPLLKAGLQRHDAAIEAAQRCT